MRDPFETSLGSASTAVIILVLLAMLSSLGSASLWPQFQKELNNTGYTNDFGIPENYVDDYTYVLGDKLKGYATPVADQEAVYVGSEFGSFSAVWRENGTKKWEKESAVGGAIQGAAALTDSKVFSAVKDSSVGVGVFSAWKENGTIIDDITRSSLGGEVIAPVAYDDATVFVPLSTGNNELVALHDNLSVKWRYQAGNAIKAGVALTDKYVIVYDQGSDLTALHKNNGTEEWSTNLPDNSGRRGNTPTIVNDTIYTVSSSGDLFANKVESGNQVWGPVSLGNDVVGSPAYLNGSLYTADFGQNVYSINASDGAIQINKSFTEYYIRSSPSVSKETVYFGSLNVNDNTGEFIALNASDLSLKWKYKDPGREVQYSGSAVVGSQVIFTSNDDNLYILEGPTPDLEPPEVKDKNLIDRTDFNAILKNGETVSVYANVTDNKSDIDSVEADLSEFGAGSSVTLTKENLTGDSFDWNGDGQLDGSIYGTNASVDETASTDGGGKTTDLTAIDTKGNSIRTDRFGNLMVDTTTPVFENIDPSGYVSTATPIVDANFTEETSGLSDSTQVNVTDSSRTVLDGTVADFSGVSISGLDKIVFDFSTIGALSEGDVSIEMTAEDEAGNKGISSITSFTVDSLAPADMNISVPESRTYLQSEDNLTVNYSYTETNPFFTELNFTNQQGGIDAALNLTEDQSDPEDSLEIYLNNQSHDFTAGYTYDITLFAEDLAGNSNSITETELLTVDDTKPVLNDSQKTGLKSFEFKVFDNEALNVSTVAASEFEFKTPGITGIFEKEPCVDFYESCTVNVTLDSLADKDNITVGLSEEENVSDAAGNIQKDDNATVTGMDEIAPNISDTNLEDYTDGDGIVTSGHYVLVHVNVTDGEEVDTVEANMTEFGLGNIVLESEPSSGIDWYADGKENQDVYGANVSVDGSAPDGEGKSLWITANDTSSNTNTSDAFGDLEVDNTPPEITVDNPLNVDPEYVQPVNDLNFSFTYTEKNPEYLNVSLSNASGLEFVIFSGFSSSTSISDNRIFSSTDLPGEGIYDLELVMNDSVGQEASGLQQDSVYIDGTPPGLVQNLKHIDESANVGYSDDLKLNFTWDEAPDDISGVANYTVYVSRDGGSSFDSGVDTADLNYTVNSNEGEKVQVKVFATDRAGNEGNNETSNVIEVDTVPPEVNIANPLAEDDIVNSTEVLTFKVNGTIQNDDVGDIFVNISDSSGASVSATSTFSGGNFSQEFDISGLNEGDLTVEANATDEAGNTGNKDSRTAIKDTVAPSIDDAFKINTTEFNTTFSDALTGLVPGSIQISDFNLSPAGEREFPSNPLKVIDTDNISEGDNIGNVTVSIDKVDADELNFSVTGEIVDVAGNILDSGFVLVDGMDSIPPSIKSFGLDEIASSDGIVTPGDSLKVYANVTDGVKVSQVNANMTEFDKEYIELVTENSAGRDWNSDGEQKSNVYGAEITVPETAPDNPDASSWINATDNSSNTNTTQEFGSLEIDNSPPQVNIYTPIARDGIINSSETSNFKVNGTIENDNSGQITVNVSDASMNNSKQASFSGGTFEVFMDASMLDEGTINVEAVATDEVGKTGDLASESLIKDTQAPSIEQGFHINTTAFNTTFSDGISGLDPPSFESSEFNTDHGSFESVSTRFSSGETQGNLTTEITSVDSETVNFSITGQVRDEAGNILDSGWVQMNGMDNISPSFDSLKLSDKDGDGIVASGNKIQVYANISDGTGVKSAQANLTEFDAGRVSLTNETTLNFDWNGDGTLDSDVYGTNATVGKNAVSGTGSATVNATDNSSNLNENTSEEFGGLDIVTEDPRINISSPLGSDPVYLKETDDLDVVFNYTETNPDELKITVGSKSTIFNSLSGGNDVETSRTLSYLDLPGNGTYDLSLNLTNTAGLYGNNSEASSVIIDSFAPGDLSIDSPTSKKYLKSSEILSVNYSYTEANPDWTDVRLLNNSGDEGLSINISETNSDPDNKVDFTGLENLDEGINYSIEVEASDKVGRTAIVSNSNLVVVDDTAPVLKDPRKISDGVYRFDIFDNASGISISDLSSSDLEIKQDVSASFNIMTCNEGDFNCTVEVDILDNTNEQQLTAQITESTGSISDVTGNTRNDNQVILQDTDTLKPALESYSLNVSEPVNNSYASDTINVTLEFNESMDTSVVPSVDINNLDSPYAPSGSYFNSTHWSGVFDILDQDEQSEAYINISGAEDEAGNTLMDSQNSAIFDVDTEEPVINVLNNFADQNLTGTVDLNNYFEETTSNGFLDTYEFRDSGSWQEITTSSSWNSEEASDENVYFRVNASDTTGNTASLTRVSNVDNTPPVFNQSNIEIVDDAGTSGILNMDDNFSVEVNATDQHSDVSEVYVNVSKVTDLSGWILLDEKASGNFSKVFKANESAQITDYSPEIRAIDTPGNENESVTENSIEVDSRPLDLIPDSIYTIVGDDKYNNDIINPGDDINVSWNSSETAITNIKTVQVDFGEYGGVVGASEEGDGVYSAITTVGEGNKNGEVYFGNIEVTTSSGTDNETSDRGVAVNNEDPSAPSDLDASKASGGNVDLSWISSPSLDASDYSIYRNDSYVGEASTTFYNDESLTSGETYVYKVATVDNASNEGLNSSEVSIEPDGKAPVVESAVTYNRTAVNVTLKDELNNVDVSETNILDFSPGSSPYYTGFGADAPIVEGLFLSSTQYSTGAEPEITVNPKDDVGNSQGFAYTVTAEDGVEPKIGTLSMENVTAAKETQLEIVYTEDMDQSIVPDIGIQGPTPDSSNGRWTAYDTYTVDYTFNYEGEASATLVTGNASDDSGNIQENDQSRGFEIDTIVPKPSIRDLNEDDVVSDDLLLNMSVIDGEDVDDVEWKYETVSNQSVTVLGSPRNESLWNTPTIEDEVKLWLEVSDPVGNTGADSVNITVDNIAPDILGDLPDYSSGTIDLNSSIYADEEASVNYEYKNSGTWTEITDPASWDTEDISDGSTRVRVNATDLAGNFNSLDYSTVIDNTLPGSFEFDDSSDKIISAGEEFDVNYSYVEANPDNTTVKVLDSGSTLVDQKFIRESGADPAENLTFDTSGYASDNYTVKIVAKDLAGLENSTEAFNVFVDDEKPRLGNETYYNMTRMSFQVIDEVSGVDASSIDPSKFEIITDSVEASSFDIVNCEHGDLNCTVNITLKDGSSLAEVGVTGPVTDRAGNEVDNTAYIIDPDVDGPQANMSVNLSSPYNLDHAGKEVNLILEFDRKIDTGPREEIDFVGSSVNYDLRGTFYNSTYWNGTFTLTNDSQEDDITVNASNIQDLDGNELLQNEVGSLLVDFRPPEVDLSRVDENVSGLLNITSAIKSQSSGVDKFNISYGEDRTQINNPDEWNTTGVKDGNLTLYLEASDEAGNNASESKKITVDNRNPEVSDISINASSQEAIGLGNVINLTVNASDNGTGISKISANVSNISTNDTVELRKQNDGNYSNTVEVEKEVKLSNYSIEIETSDYAGNTVQNTTENISINSTQQEDQDPDDGQNNDDSDPDDSGGGGFLLPEDDQDDSNNDSQDGTQGSDNQDDSDNSTLQPSDPLSVNINPQTAFLDSKVGEEVVFRPEISVSESSLVELDLQGFDSNFQREIQIDNSRKVTVDLGEFNDEEVFTGTLVASAQDVSTTASISVDVSKDRKEVDMDSRVDDGKIKFNSSIDTDGQVEVTTKVYKAESREVVYRSSNNTSFDQGYSSELSLEELSPGLYTVETRIEDDENIYIAEDQFRIDEPFDPITAIAGLLLFMTAASLAYIASNRTRSQDIRKEISESPELQMNTSTSTQRQTETPEKKETPEKSEERRNPFEKIDSEFGDDEVIKEIEEASERFSSGEITGADSKLREAKEAGFFDSENIEDVKDKMKEVHKKFEDHL